MSKEPCACRDCGETTDEGEFCASCDEAGCEDAHDGYGACQALDQVTVQLDEAFRRFGGPVFSE